MEWIFKLTFLVIDILSNTIWVVLKVALSELKQTFRIQKNTIDPDQKETNWTTWLLTLGRVC